MGAVREAFKMCDQRELKFDEANSAEFGRIPGLCFMVTRPGTANTKINFAAIPVPLGTPDRSPAIYCRVSGVKKRRPIGTLDW